MAARSDFASVMGLVRQAFEYQMGETDHPPAAATTELGAGRTLTDTPTVRLTLRRWVSIRDRSSA